MSSANSDPPDHDTPTQTPLTEDLPPISDFATQESIAPPAPEEPALPMPEAPPELPDASAATPAPAMPDVPAPPSTLEQIRAFSENLPAVKASAAAELPFTLHIEGVLTANERSRLLDLISREDMGVREVDLEPQISAGRLLIPRISEFAAVLIIQALRDAQITIRMTLSDLETDLPADGSSHEMMPKISKELPAEDTHAHPAELIPLVTSHAQTPTPNAVEWEILGAVQASATLQTSMLESKSSPEYSDLLDALERKLKYEAHYKGATIVLGYSNTLTPLSAHTRFRLTLTGTAARPKGGPFSGGWTPSA